jgi:hypothetical protein
MNEMKWMNGMNDWTEWNGMEWNEWMKWNEMNEWNEMKLVLVLVGVHFDLVKFISKSSTAAKSLTQLTLSWVIWIGDLDLDEIVDKALVPVGDSRYY